VLTVAYQCHHQPALFALQLRRFLCVPGTSAAGFEPTQNSLKIGAKHSATSDGGFCCCGEVASPLVHSHVEVSKTIDDVLVKLMQVSNIFIVEYVCLTAL